MLARFVHDVLRAAERRGIAREALLEGVPLRARAGADGRIPWDDFVDLMIRLEGAVEGPAGLESLGEQVAGVRIAPVLRRVAGLAARPTVLYRAGERWALRRAMPVLETSLEVQPRRADGRARVRMTCEVPESVRPCPQILHVTVGGLRALPGVLGLPDALVEARVGERRAVYGVSLPPPDMPWRRVWSALRALLSSRAAFAQLDGQQRELRCQYEELRAAHARLEESEARHRALSESAIDIVGEIGPDGTLLYLSPSVTEITGFPRDEIIGTSFEAWVHPDDLAPMGRTLREVLDGTAQGRPVCRVRRREGGWVWLETEGRCYRSRTGAPRVVVILRDVSDRVRLEEERQRHAAELEAEVARRTAQLERRNRELRELQTLLLEAERLGTAHDVAGRVAHSINNPLAALIGHLQLALDEGELPPSRIERLLELAHRVSDVVERTLEFYRERKLDRAPLDVVGVLDEVRLHVAERARPRGVRIEVERRGARDLPRVQADRPLLAAALESLTANGIEATPPGGRVVLSAEAEPVRGVVLLRVEDEGEGVPAALRRRIFEPFFTTRGSRGTGLGLAIAQGIVQGHGGEIHVGDRPEGGAVFTVELPLDPPAPATGDGA